jgi:hypothetical protein
VSGRTSLYIRGHLVSGKLGGSGNASNLTPLTRSANAAMEHGMEGKAKQLVRKNMSRPNEKKSVYGYTVRAGGAAGLGSPMRWIVLLPGTPPVHQVVPQEALLARTITAVLKKKRYEPTSGKWIDGTTLRTRTFNNVPPFPPGHQPPAAPGGATPAGGGATPAGGGATPGGVHAAGGGGTAQ